MKTSNRVVALLVIQSLTVTMLLAAFVLPIQPVAAFTSANADSAMSAFVNVFWNSTKKYFYTNSDHQIQAHASGPESGLYTDFWWEAQLWETVMDAYQRTNSASYRQMIDDVYDGFAAYYPNFDNNFNDDQGWGALASARAFEITGNVRYRDRAIDLFNRITVSSELDSTYGGGIWWRKSPHDQKNVATNGPAVITAIKIYNFNRTTYAAYLTKAQSLYTWLKNNLTSGNRVFDHIEGPGSGTVVKWDFTYNAGAFIGAASALYDATGTASYLTDATNAADWIVANMTNGGTLMYEGVDDGGGFKMIFARYLNRLVTQYNKTQYLSFLRNNATQAWNHRRTSDNITGPDWSAPTGSGYVQSLTAAAETALLQFVSPDNVSSILGESGNYEAENARINGISTESTNAGYSGRGYLAGWNSSGTSVTFNINVGSSGTYQLGLRYAAAAGNATRKISVNGNVVSGNFIFTGTGNWSTYSNANLNNVNLNVGYNSIEVADDAGYSNSNWLNLDKLTLTLTGGTTGQTLQAENATLHSLSTEAVYSGYHGSGYVAGWNSNGQWLDFSVNVSTNGSYNLTLRYAAAAGNASRQIYVNGTTIVVNQNFPSTGSWSSWNTVTITGVQLNTGSNTVSVIFSSSLGNTNWLNLDELTIQ